MQYLSDMHTHSIASGHGSRSTISAMAKAASLRGLRLLGITDHGPATMLAGTPSYFRSLTYAPRERFGLTLLYGVELNLLDRDGHVDLDDEVLRKLDYAVVSMHSRNYRSGTAAENTLALRRAMAHPCVRILGHCDDPQFPVDYDELAVSAREYGVVFEINEASLAPYGYRGDTRPNCTRILEVSRRYGLPVLLSSDSHGPEHVGDFTFAAEFIHEAAFPESQILNNQIPRLKAFLTSRS